MKEFYKKSNNLFQKFSDLSNGSLSFEDAEKGFYDWIDVLDYEEEEGLDELLKKPNSIIIQLLSVREQPRRKRRGF